MLFTSDASSSNRAGDRDRVRGVGVPVVISVVRLVSLVVTGDKPTG